jgi:3-oxoacyl-[acyl-carrier protein] reductase
VEAIAETAVRECGRLDAWINSAGISMWADVIDATPEEAGKVVAVNLMGTYWGCAVAGRAMKERGGGGAIVNMSSIAGANSFPGLSVYGMTKAAVSQLTKVCASEFGPFGVRVNALAPGWIDTPMNATPYLTASGEVDTELRGKVMHDMASLSPLGLTGEPIDIALAMLYLASDASRFVTGQTLRVSGGV